MHCSKEIFEHITYNLINNSHKRHDLIIKLQLNYDEFQTYKKNKSKREN